MDLFVFVFNHQACPFANSGRGQNRLSRACYKDTIYMSFLRLYTCKTRRHNERAISPGGGVIQFTVWLLSVHRATLVDRSCFWRNPTHDSPSGTPAAVQLSSITISSSAKRLLAVGTVTPCVFVRVA